MPWSFQIARVFGIPIRVHATFLLLPVLVAFTQSGGTGMRGSLGSVLLVLVLFVFVVLHELGHSLVAKAFGLRIVDITLLPIGGLARMADPPRTAGQEVLIAVAGPAVNFALAAGFLVLNVALGVSIQHFDPLAPNLLVQGFAVNLTLGAFNLVPAFPMDGGRVLRGLLAALFGFRRATRVAVVVGQIFGLAAIAIGVLYPGSFWLAVIGLFVFLGAGQEERANALRFALEGVPVSTAMVRHFTSVDPDLSLGELSDRMRSGFQEDFPVVRKGTLVGLLCKRDFLKAMERFSAETPLASILPSSYLTATPESPLLDLYREMARSGSSAAAVVESGELLGIVTLERIAKLLVHKRGGSA